MFSRRIMILIQALSIVMFALIAALIPQYFFLVFILYFLVIMLLSVKMGSRGFKRAEDLIGPVLFKENAAAQVMMYDSLVVNEFKSQIKSTTIYLVLPLLVLVLIPLYYGYIGPYVQELAGALGNEVLVRFIYFIVMYLFLTGVLQALRVVITKLVKQPKQLIIPRSFTVYKSGIVLDGRFLEYSRDMCIEENRDRRFIEIHGEKLPYVIRLYTLEISKLYSKMREVGLNEC
ncbi:MAG: DUF2208 domain-containing protein [Desulfurococcaceae archaeon]|nr:DUF2208 domain-containing protein [Desulfurococcaceae archaeon]